MPIDYGSFEWPSLVSSGVNVYPSIGSFPVSSFTGDLGVAADTGILYEFNGVSWVPIASNVAYLDALSAAGAATSIGPLDSQAANAQGLSLVAHVLSTQSADSTHPGMVNNTTQTFSGLKTFSNQLTVSSGATSLTTIMSSTNANGSYSQWNNSATANGYIGSAKAVFSAGALSDFAISGQNNLVLGTGINPQVTITSAGQVVIAVDLTVVGAATIIGSISASNLSGTNTGNVTLATVGAVPNAFGGSLSGQVLTLQPANTSFPGVLTAADWNTFNNKQPAGSYVTAITVASANGLAGSSSGGTTPSLTLSTSITGILQGNGTAISVASTTGSGAVVLATSPTLVTPVIGVASGTSLDLSNSLTTTYNGLTLTNTSTTGGTANAQILLSTYNGSIVTIGGAIGNTANSWLYHGYGANSTFLESLGTGGVVVVAVEPSSGIRFLTGGDQVGNERMRISSTGQVGIGETPTVQFDVYDPSNSLTALFKSGSVNGVYTQWQNGVTANGYAGAGSALFASGNLADFGISAAAGSLVLGTGTTANLTIASSGVATFTGGATNVKGTSTNNSAAAGYVGEAVRAAVVASGTALTTGTGLSLTSISLTAGDWDVSCMICFNGAVTATVFSGSISATNNTLAGNYGDDTFQSSLAPTAVADACFSIPSLRVNLASTTTYYLVAQATFTVGTCKAYGRISARRVR